MILSSLYIGDSYERGRGVFSSESIAAGKIIEISPVIVMGQDERILLDKTLLHDYIFEWGEDEKKCCMALGYLSLYNHNYCSNAEYIMDFALQTIKITTVRHIKRDEEIFINYNGNWNNPKKVWFDKNRP